MKNRKFYAFGVGMYGSSQFFYPRLIISKSLRIGYDLPILYSALVHIAITNSWRRIGASRKGERSDEEYLVAHMQCFELLLSNLPNVDPEIHTLQHIWRSI